MTELNFIFAFAITMCFFLALVVFGLPSNLQLVSTFDFIWLIFGFIGIAVACNVITGLACVVGTAVFTSATLITYIGVGFFALNPGSTLILIKGLVFTPLTVGISYIESRLARGGG